MTNKSHSIEDNNRTNNVNISNVEGDIYNSTIAGRDVNELTIDQMVITTIEDSEAATQHRHRLDLLERVEQLWIKEGLERLLAGQAMRTPPIEQLPHAVHYPWEMVVDISDQNNMLLPVETTVVDVWAEMEGALLILGEVGSGKTILLLNLAGQAITLAKHNATQPVPVVLSLASWTSKYCLEDWLLAELKNQYVNVIPEAMARLWLESDQIFLLLDDLDKIQPQKHRETCVEAINAFYQEHGLMPIVVCCRSDAYEVLKVRLQLKGAICLK